MRAINFTLGDIETVLVVARLGSFRAAADELNLAQSTVSSRVQRVEASLSTKLFHRTTRRVTITPHGKQVCDAAGRSIEALRGLAREFHEENRLLHGRVTVGAVQTVASTLAADVLAVFERSRPGISVSLRDDFVAASFRSLADGQFDFAVTTIPEPHPHIEFDQLLIEELVLCVRDDHPLAATPFASCATIAAHSLLLAPQWELLDRTLTDAFRREGVELRARYQALHPLTRLGMTRRGLGATVLPAMLLPLLDMAGLHVVRIGREGLFRRIGLATARGRNLSPAARALIESFHREARVRGMKVSGTG